MRASLLAVLLVACSSSSSQPDADFIDADPNLCLVAPDFGALGSRSGTPGVDGASPTLTVPIDTRGEVDALWFKLVDGRGVFAAGVAPGTYDMSGTESDFYTCGICVQVLANMSSITTHKYYLAQSGTVTLTSTSPLAGSASNLVFVEVDLIGQRVSSTCGTRIASIAFTTQP